MNQRWKKGVFLLAAAAVMCMSVQPLTVQAEISESESIETESETSLESADTIEETEYKEEETAETENMPQSEEITDDTEQQTEAAADSESKEETEIEETEASGEIKPEESNTADTEAAETETETEESEEIEEGTLWDDPEADRSYRSAMLDNSEISLFSSPVQRQIKAYGIDVSQWNGDIDWKKVKAAGVDFAIIRVALRGYANGRLAIDPYALQNLKGAQDAGIKIGAYFFSTALNEKEAEEEAQYTIDIIKNYNITYPVIYDCEGYEYSYYRTYGLSKKQRTNNAIAFLNYIKKAGYTPMMYGSKSYLENDNKWETSRIDPLFDVWVAQYPYADASKNQYKSYDAIKGEYTSYTGDYNMWQFSSQGKIAGISTNVDLNIEYYDIGDEGVKGEERCVDGKWYFYYEDGTMATGWVRHHGNQYYYDNNGVMQKGIVKIGNKTYGFNEWTGVLLSGEHYFTDGSHEDWYYFDPATGEMATGWVKHHGKQYYYNNKGAMQKRIVKIGNKTYGFDEWTGVLLSGEHYFTDGSSDKWYYFDPATGEMKKGWIKYNGHNYYFNEKGEMHHGEICLDGYWYYLDEWTGIMAVGWTTHHNEWYYYDQQGRMYHGEHYIDGHWYYFDQYTGITANKGFTYHHGHWYYYNDYGYMQYGKQKIDGKWYYFDPITGILQGER